MPQTVPATITVKKQWSGGATDALKALAEGLNNIIVGTVSVNPPSINAGAETDVDVAVAGILATDFVFVMTPPTLEAGLYPRRVVVPANGTLRITLRNETAGAVDGAALTWGFLIVRKAPFTFV